MARVTERVRLGPAALNPFTLHPYEIAGQTAMLDLASGGRAYLGLVKGAWLDRLGLDERAASAWHCGKRSRSSRSCSPATRAGSRASASRSRRGRPSPTSALRPSVPLLIGTWGERTAAWAGTVAAELKIGGSANPELVPVMRGWAGRPTCASSSAASRSSTRTGRGRGSARGRRWRRTSTSSPVSTRRSSCDRARSRRSTASRSRGRPRRWPRGCIALWEAGADRVELGTPQGRTTRDGRAAHLRARAAAAAALRSPARPRRAARRRRPPRRSGATRRGRARAAARRSDAAGRR